VTAGEAAPLDPVRWRDGALRLIDQRRLPGELAYLECRTVDAVAEAIRNLAVRGAPAIGVAAAYGVLLGAETAARAGKDPMPAAREAARVLAATRPTAVNLFAGLARMEAALDAGSARGLLDHLRREADRLLEEDLLTGRRIAEHGLGVLPAGEPLRVLTHCNAGGLATGGWGTALAPLYAAHRSGRRLEVFANETRPLWQGARLTAWELSRAGIPVTVLVDGAASLLLARGRVDVVIVGADRVARNGDTANKIGTLGVALAARHAGVPFYVAAPLSTFDPRAPDGASIPIEERAEAEVLGSQAPPGVRAWNPAFDVTPAGLIRGWITEVGVLRPPFPLPGTGTTPAPDPVD
jgi:methylthioribose-1-phosphate isomerase